jgi:hypothetical protein
MVRAAWTRSAIAGLALAAAPMSEARAQDRRAEVRGVIDRMFDALRAADTSAIRSTFHPEFRLAITSFRDGQPEVRLVSGDDFIASVGRAEEKLDERIGDVDIRVEDNVATVWNRYVFYVGDRLSHCGIDAFTLVHLPEGWRILHVADTQRREGCTPLRE